MMWVNKKSNFLRKHMSKKEEQKSKTVLLVEDDVFIREIYDKKISLEGYKVELAKNGLEAIKKLEEITPDLILLDIIMPVMDGREVLAKLKSSKKWKNIPVVMLTNLSEKEEIEEELGLGVDEYIVKAHFTPSEVMEKIKKFLK